MFKHLIEKSTGATEAFVPSSGRSDLFNALSELCQSVFDNLPKDIADFSNNAAVDAAYAAMKAADFTKNLIAIVKTHLNLGITKVEIWKGQFLNAAMGFGIDIPKKGGKEQIFATDVPQYSLVNVLQILSQLSDTQNNDGSIAPSETISKLIIADFYFIPTWWVIPNLWPGYSVSADSIAAIILHELGHALNFYRDFGSIRKYNNVVSDLLPHVAKARTRKDYEEIFSIYDQITEDLKNKLKDANTYALNARDIKQAKDVIAAQTFLITECRKLLADTKDADLNTAKNLNASLYFASVLIIEYAIHLNGWFSYPLTELRKTDTQYTHEERLADEFAVRNGAGSALSSALLLLTTLGEKYKNKPISTFRMIPVIKQVADFMAYLGTVTDVSSTVVCTTYDPPVERLRQIVKSSMGAIKDKSLDVAARDFYADQIKATQAILDEYANADTTKARQKFADLTGAVFTVAFIPLMIMLKRLGSQYHCLQDWTDNLIRNELAYHSARIDKLTR